CVDANVRELGQVAAYVLLDLTREGVRVGQRAPRVEAQRKEGDEPLLGLEKANLARRSPGSAGDDPPDALCISLDVRARGGTPGGRLAQRLEVRLHGDDLGNG